eukprot:scaffold40601_cov55-Phaeocystis_antarctica.AAC.2
MASGAAWSRPSPDAPPRHHWAHRRWAQRHWARGCAAGSPNTRAAAASRAGRAPRPVGGVGTTSPSPYPYSMTLTLTLTLTLTGTRLYRWRGHDARCEATMEHPATGGFGGRFNVRYALGLGLA